MSKRAIICDDSRVTRRVIADALAADGWETIAEAEKAVDIVHLFEAIRPDLVTMDLALKGQYNGIWAIREIRGVDPRVPIVVVSSVMQPKVVRESLDAGASDYICKPFKPEELCEVVDHCFARETPAAV